jgi:hypothetical protein
MQISKQLHILDWSGLKACREFIHNGTPSLSFPFRFVFRGLAGWCLEAV